MDVINTIANGATTVEEVRNLTFATGGNGCCTRQVERLIECIHSKQRYSKLGDSSLSASSTETPLRLA